MIQEVIPREAELKLLILGAAKREILEQRQVGVEESRASQGREDIATLLTGRGKRREAGTVDVLVCLQPCAWIAGKCGHESDIRTAKHVLTARLHGWGSRRAHKRGSGRDECRIVKVRADGRLQVHATLVLGSARYLPAVRYAFHEPVGIGQGGKFVDIGKVENVGPIIGERPVIVSKVGWVAACRAALAANAQRLAERVVREEGEVPCLFIPRHLQAVVVGIHLVVDNLQGAETIIRGDARTSIERASVVYSGCVVAAGLPAARLIMVCAASAGIEHRPDREIIDLVKVVVPVAQVVGLAADVRDLQEALPRQTLVQTKAVALSSRLLGIGGIQGRDSARRSGRSGGKRGKLRAPQRRRGKRSPDYTVSAILHVLLVVEMVHAVAAAQHGSAGTKEIPGNTHTRIVIKQPAA